MAEYSKEKLYYLKLDKNFFDKHFVKVIYRRKHGDRMMMFLIRLMTESISYNGYLRFSEDVPYDDEMLAGVLDTDLEIVKKSLKIFSDLKIIEITDNNTIFIPFVQTMTSSSTVGAIRKAEKRTLGGQKGDNTETKGGQKFTYKNINKSIEYRDKSIEYRDTNVSNIEMNKEEEIKNKEIEVGEENEKLSTICENECGNVENSSQNERLAKQTDDTNMAEIIRIAKTPWLDD